MKNSVKDCLTSILIILLVILIYVGIFKISPILGLILVIINFLLLLNS